MFDRKTQPASELNYTIRRSQRAKKMRIIVTPEKVEVVAPLKHSEQKIRQFVLTQQAWIKKAQLKVDHHRQAVNSFGPVSYTHGVEVPYQGKKFTLSVTRSNNTKIKIELADVVMVDVPDVIPETMLGEFIQVAYQQWCQQQALHQVEYHVEQHAPRHGLIPRSVTVKSQKSRWGSCGVHDDIYLNWLLILAPPEVLEYVVVHELCHIRERNHSAAFWALVAKHIPDYKRHRQWLKTHGASLMLGL